MLQLPKGGDNVINNLLIFGDSYSTHRDYIPENFPTYYCDGGQGPDEPVTDMLAEQTWWGQLLKTTDAKLIQNNSWTASTIGYTGYVGDCSQTSSFICRYHKLLASGFFEKNTIDTIIVFGGTNDSWSNAPLGTQQYSDWKREDLFSVLPAICYFMHTLKKNHPNARILFIVNCGIKQAIIQCVQEAALHYGVECVTLRDVDKLQGHPTVLGMQQIYDTLMQYLRNEL